MCWRLKHIVAPSKVSGNLSGDGVRAIDADGAPAYVLEYSDVLLCMLLKARDPERYDDGVRRARLERRWAQEDAQTRGGNTTVDPKLVNWLEEICALKAAAADHGRSELPNTAPNCAVSSDAGNAETPVGPLVLIVDSGMSDPPMFANMLDVLTHLVFGIVMAACLWFVDSALKDDRD
jgi:hypothetical protein